jgi:hypothetical protein
MLIEPSESMVREGSTFYGAFGEFTFIPKIDLEDEVVVGVKGTEEVARDMPFGVDS